MMRIRIWLAGLMLFVSKFLYAEIPTADSSCWNSANSGIRGIYASLGRFLRLILLIGALASLVELVFKLMKGDREGWSKALYWLLGLGGGLILLELISKMYGG